MSKITPVTSPTITPLPDRADSLPVILEHFNVDLLPVYEYVSREYLIKGVACGESYCTRLLLRCPPNVARFTGLIVLEPSHLWGGTSIWRHISRWVMRNGHAWIEVDSQSPSALGKVKMQDNVRYSGMHFSPGPLSDAFSNNIPFVQGSTKESLKSAYEEFRAKWWPAAAQCPEILVAASSARRIGELGLTATRVVMSGLSQTGGVTQHFISYFSRLALPNGELAFEGFIPAQSGGETLPDIYGAKIIELLGESEFPSVRLPCGVSGQMRNTEHRRPDSDDFRVYETAGMAHRESRYSSAIENARWGDIDLHGARWSTFANSFIHHAVFEAMDKGTSPSAVPPPPSATLETIESTDEIIRDEHGNARGGVQTLHTLAPLARLVAATPQGRPNWYRGSEWPFMDDKLRSIYECVQNYRHIAGEALTHQIEKGFQKMQR